MRASIWVSHWEQECCGERIAVGVRRQWNVEYQPSRLAGALGTAESQGVDYSEDRHDLAESPTQSLAGTVVGIREITQSYRSPEPRLFVPIEGAVVARDVDEVVISWDDEDDHELVNVDDTEGTATFGRFARGDHEPADSEMADVSGWVVTIELDEAADAGDR